MRKIGVPGLERCSGLYLWALFIVVFSFTSPSLFPQIATVHAVASAQAVPAILAVALVVPLAAGNFDLAIGATTNLAAIVVTVLQTEHNWNMWAAIVVTIGVCAVIGLINGAIIVFGHIDSFIATLGMGSVVAAVQTIISGGSQPLAPTTPLWSQLTTADVFGFNSVIIYVVVIGLLLWWLMEHTPAGRLIYVSGSNPDAARLSGVRVGKWVMFAMFMSSTLAGVAGVLYGSLSGPSLTFGSGLLLPAFAAAFLGSTQLKPGRFNVWGTVIAIYVLATGVQGFSFVTSAQWLSDMFNGVALIGAVGFAVSRGRAKRRAKAAA